VGASAATILSVSKCFAEADTEYLEYDYVDLYNPMHVLGRDDPSERDVATALASFYPTSAPAQLPARPGLFFPCSLTGAELSPKHSFRIGNPLHQMKNNIAEQQCQQSKSTGYDHQHDKHHCDD
jgi:hypothetical protein